MKERFGTLRWRQNLRTGETRDLWVANYSSSRKINGLQDRRILASSSPHGVHSGSVGQINQGKNRYPGAWSDPNITP